MQGGEHRGAAAAEQGGERRGRRGAARLPQRRDAARRVDDERLPRRLDRGGRPGPGERARDEQQPAPREVEVAVERHVDEERVVGEAQLGVDVGEQPLRAAVGEPARAVQDVALEQRADPRPVRGEGARPVRADEVGERGDRCRRIVVERLQYGRQRRRRVHAPHLGAHLVGGRREHLRELGLEVAERAARRRVDEVRRVGAGALERAQHADVEVRDPLAGRDDPGQVERLRLGVVERPHAVVELHQRRDREADVGDVLRPEAEADHSGESKSLRRRAGAPSLCR